MTEDYPKLAFIMLVLILAFSLHAFRPLQAQFNPAQQVVFETPFAGITTAQSSQPFRNIGQAMHLLQVTFPNETTAVTGIQIRLERCSRNCDAAPDTDWAPMGPDITEAPVLDLGIPATTEVYAYQDYYWVYRAVRVRMVIDTPGGEELTARYVGHTFPVVPFVNLRGDRWAF